MAKGVVFIILSAKRRSLFSRICNSAVVNAKPHPRPLSKGRGEWKEEVGRLKEEVVAFGEYDVLK